MSTDIIKSAAKFLQTPAKPERRLEEKIRFLIKEKKLTQYQLIAALKQANLYNIETIEPILTMCYFEQHEQLKKKSKIKPTVNKAKVSSTLHEQQQQQQLPSQSSWSPWWSSVATVGMGVASFIASYTVSTTASQNLVKKSEEKVSVQLESVKTEIKEQADLDRERQHRDLMEVVNLLKTQVQCVQQNLGVLKQSIDVIQTQMKYNNLNDPNNVASIIMQHNKNIRGSTGDDGSVISSGVSNSNNNNNNNETKPNLNVIGNLLSQNDDGLDWLNTDIVTSNMDKNMNDNDEKKKKLNDNENKQSMNDNITINENENENKNESEDIESVDENDVIYHQDYKDMISTLPTDIIEIKQQLTGLLKLWQRTVLKHENENENENENGLSVDKIKAGINALNFYINKILKKPFVEQTRKINTYNKQYKERLSRLPNIDKLLSLIGFEKDNVFWMLPLLYDENGKNNDEKCKKSHDRQIDFLTAFKQVTANLFNNDSLPFELSEAIMKIKRERQEKEKEKEIKNEVKNETKEEKKEENKNENNININSNNGVVTNNGVITNNGVVTNGNIDKTNNDSTNGDAPETQYPNKFMEIAALVQQGKKPNDVKVIDDMPPNPNAAPSQSKMEQQKKPFEDGNNKNNNGLNWFEQYEAQDGVTDNGNVNNEQNNNNNKENTTGDNKDAIQNHNNV